MSELPPSGPSDDAPAPMAKAVVRKSSSISFIWLIPIVAALAGGFLAWKAISEQGPTITILFDDAEGLQEEKTKIRYKDVEVGVVESIDFTEDLEKVKVTASLVKGAAPYLNEETRFWVVRAEISAEQITGLGTVLAGAYIAADLSNEGRSKKAFVGLERAPIVTSEDKGSLYTLRAKSLGSIGVGAPVYFRSFKVGKIVAYELDESGDFFTMQAFVRKPYDARISSQTRFWNASGIDFVVSAEGVRVDTPSLISALIGGVAFDNPEDSDNSAAVGPDTIFGLYENKDASLRKRYSEKARYLVHFDESVSGLTIGAPVEFRGIKLGQVVDIKLTYDFTRRELEIPVVLELEPGRIESLEESGNETNDRGIEDLVRDGLRARLATGNLLTGQLKVDLDVLHDAEPAEIKMGGRYPELPSAPGTLNQIADSFARLMDKLDDVPIDEIGDKVDTLLGQLEATVSELNTLAGQVNKDIAPALAASLVSLEKTLDSTESVIGPDSAVNAELERLLLDLGDAARSMRLLTERLEEHPEDLLRGKGR